MDVFSKNRDPEIALACFVEIADGLAPYGHKFSSRVRRVYGRVSPPLLPRHGIDHDSKPLHLTTPELGGPLAKGRGAPFKKVKPAKKATRTRKGAGTPAAECSNRKTRSSP
jgi:hypothetical protein